MLSSVAMSLTLTEALEYFDPFGREPYLPLIDIDAILYMGGYGDGIR